MNGGFLTCELPSFRAAVLANTLPATNPDFTTSATGPYFSDPQQIGTGGGAIQFSFGMAINMPASGARTLLNTTGNYLKLEVLPNGALRLPVITPSGKGKVVRHNAICNRVAVRLEGDLEIEFTADKVNQKKE